VAVDLPGNENTERPIFPAPHHQVQPLSRNSCQTQGPIAVIQRGYETRGDSVLTAGVATLGRALEHYALFPARTNVHFLQVINRQHIRLRIWERGGVALGARAAQR